LIPEEAPDTLVALLLEFIGAAHFRAERDICNWENGFQRLYCSCCPSTFNLDSWQTAEKYRSTPVRRSRGALAIRAGPR
jgi:hypothetical protein